MTVRSHLPTLLTEVKMFELTLDLQPEGNTRNTFHTQNAYPGQIERSDFFDYGSDLKAQGSLVDVIHGTMDSSPSSPPATLIITDFQFISLDASRRFRYARIELHFSDIDPGDHNPPEVKAIAPEGSFSLNQTEEIRELKRAAKADAGAAMVANVSMGLEWSITQTSTTTKSAKLGGLQTKQDRRKEPKNLPVWSLDENNSDNKGIPSLLRTAILLRRNNDKNFLGHITVEAKVDWKTRYNLESRKADGQIDPVTFDPKKTRVIPIPPYIDATNLGSVDLTQLAAVQSTTSMKATPTIQPNILTDGKVLGLTIENVMRTPQTLEDHTATSSDKPEPGPLPQEPELDKQPDLHETIRLLLHAVRKGGEVIAEAVSTFLNFLSAHLWVVLIVWYRIEYHWRLGRSQLGRLPLQKKESRLRTTRDEEGDRTSPLALALGSELLLVRWITVRFAAGLQSFQL